MAAQVRTAATAPRSNTAQKHRGSLTVGPPLIYSSVECLLGARQPRARLAAVVSGSLAGAADTHAPGTRDHGRPGYSSRSGSHTAAAIPHRAHWWGRPRQSSRDSDARTGTYARMFAVLLLLCLLMVVGAIICAAAVLRMWSDDSKDS